MSGKKENYDQQLTAILSTMAEAGMQNAARGMSIMVGETLSVSEPKVNVVSLTELPNLLGGPETEAVGIYLRYDGMMSGQFMMMLSIQEALEMVDLLMGEPVGTTKNLGAIERSGLSELGNLTGTFFLNAVAQLTGLEARPSPPAVMVDMIGAILNILLISWDGLSENVLMIEAIFMRNGRQAQANFWVIPDRSTLEAIAKIQVTRNKLAHGK